MHALLRISYLVIGCAPVAYLSGCSGTISGVTGGQQNGVITQLGVARSISPQGFSLPSVAARPTVQARGTGAAPKPFMNSAAMKNVGQIIAVSDQINAVVDIFTPSGKQIGRLSDFSSPQGLASDIKGDLYVADEFKNRVVVYSTGLQSAPRYLKDPGEYPVGVDSFGNGRYVAVTNINSASGGQGSVSLYRGSKLAATIIDSNLSRAYFCAFDATGNLFVSGMDPNGVATVGEIANVPSGGTTYAILTTTNAITFPGGVQVTTSGQIAIDDQGSGHGPSTVYTYEPPVNNSLGAPVATTVMTGSRDAVTFAFTRNMTDFYDADNGLDIVNEYAYPNGGAPISSIAIPSGPYAGVAIGVAVIPSQFPK